MIVKLDIFYVLCLYVKGSEAPAGAQGLTELRPRVGPLKKDLTRAGGGEESGRLWEAQSVVLHTLRAVPPTQLSLFRVSF